MVQMEKDWKLKICLRFCSLAATYSNDRQNFTKDGFSWQNSIDICSATSSKLQKKTSSPTRKNPWETSWASTENTVGKERPTQPLDIHAIRCTEMSRLFLAECAKEETSTSW